MKFFFFSLRNFDVDVGESVRMYGLLNSLAADGNEVVFISNAKKHHMFHPSIRHVLIGYDFKEKRNLQGLLALFPYRVAYRKYNTLFHKIGGAISAAGVGDHPVYFMDYLDTSIGYMLKRTGYIKGYINDVHGIATIEFLNHIKNAQSKKDQLLYKLKYQLAYKLDKKVFEAADGSIYGSYAMRDYYESTYNLANKKSHVIPYLIDDRSVDRKVNPELQKELRQKLEFTERDFVVFFIGSYKPTAGVDDLIKAFELLWNQHPDAKLLLIGDGPFKERCVGIATASKAQKSIQFISNIPYAHMATYQSLASVIVCPDKNNLFSQYVIHIKYFDALLSGKLVINGAFESVKEINKDDSLSLTFEPSDVNDLYQKLSLCKKDYQRLVEKYTSVKEYTMEHFKYGSYIKSLYA